MLRFPIDFTLRNWESEFPLNDDWTLLCKGKIETNNLYVNVYLKRLGIFPSEEILISGEISNPRLSGEKKIFSNYGRIISTDMHLAKLLFGNASNLNSISCRLYGNIIIDSKCDKCVSLLKSKESDKCFQLKSLARLSDDFEILLNPETSCCADVTLTCGEVSISAHKCILSARSPFFAAMFKHPMKENLENQVCIKDVDAPVFQTMIMYIYSGKTSNLTFSSASDLLLAADKYQLQDLKEVCCDFLKSNLTLKNVVGILVLGDSLDENLKSFGVDYINKNCTDFSTFENTEEWKTLNIEHPLLAIDVLSSLMKIKDKK